MKIRKKTFERKAETIKANLQRRKLPETKTSGTLKKLGLIKILNFCMSR